MRGLKLMKEHGVEFNTLTCVQRDNSRKPLEVYRFLKEAGNGFIQFIPVVERIATGAGPVDLKLILPAADTPAVVSEWSVQPVPFGKFLCSVFDEWVRRDVGRVLSATPIFFSCSNRRPRFASRLLQLPR